MKLAIGTAQFGLHYGVANRHGQVNLEEATSILQKARSAGIDTLDTAMSYGASEQVLGEIGVREWRVVTKLPAIPVGCMDVVDWVRESVSASLERLGITRLYGLLLHRPEQLGTAYGESLYKAIDELKNQGKVEKIGISIYDPDELADLLTRFALDLVQVPLNIFDRRLITTGWLRRLHDAGIEIHTRSIFLQGLLLMSPEKIPNQFNHWQPLWTRWQAWLQENNLSALQACLGFVLAHNDIDRVILGVDSQDQLKEIFSAAKGPVPSPPAELSCEDIDLINPSRWSQL